MASTYTLELEGRGTSGTNRTKTWVLDVTDYDPSTNVQLSASELGLKRLDRIEVQSREMGFHAAWNGDAESPEVLLRGAPASPSAGDEFVEKGSSGSDHGEFTLVAYGK